MSKIWDELMDTFGRGPIGHRAPPHHRHPRPKAPPNPAFIRKAILEIRYRQHPHRIHTMSTASLTFTLPTTRTDESALSPDEVASVDVFDDVGDGNGPQKIGTIPGAGNSFTTPTLKVGNHSFTVVVNDTTGHVSGPSNAAALQVPATLAAPSAVTDLAATLNQS